MATDGNLNVVISANVQDLKKGLVQAEKGIKQFDTSTKKMTGTTKKMTGGLVKGAVPAMTSFSQVVQDAPFGIRGVANNIQQLTMQMGHLSANAGGTKNALKAMASTLVGPAGILLAVSVVTSLLVSYGDTLFSTTKKADKLAKAQEDLAKSLEDYEASLKGVNKAQVDAGRSSAKELTNLMLLAKQAENVTLSNEKRIEAISELRKQYPSYLKGMTDEGILAEGLTSIYDELTSKILQKAKAQAAANLITKNFQKEIALTDQLRKAATDNAKTFIILEAAKSKVIEGNVAERKAGEEAVLRLGGKQADALKEQTKIQQEIVDLQSESLRLAGFISEQGGVVPLSFKVDKDPTVEIEGGIAAKVGEGIQNALIKDTKGGSIIVELPPVQVKLREITDGWTVRLNQFNEEANNIIQSGVRGTFEGIGEAIGSGLQGGSNVLQGVGGALLAGIGGIAIQLGKAAIKIGVTMEAIKLSFSNPFTAIAAGVALIALGTAMKGTANDIVGGGGGSGGGLSTDYSGGGSSGGFRGSSSVSANTSGGGTVVFEIAGTKLIGVIDNTLKRNRSLGGSTNLLLT